MTCRRPRLDVARRAHQWPGTWCTYRRSQYERYSLAVTSDGKVGPSGVVLRPLSHCRCDNVSAGPLTDARRATGVAWNVRRVLAKTPSRRHFESKRTSKTGSTSKIGSRNGFVRFGNFCIFRSLSPPGVLNSGHKLTVTYYGEITIEPILNPEFDVDHDFEVKNGCFQSLFPRFRVISVYSTGRASHSDHFSGQVSMATILQDFYLFRRGFQHRVRDHLPDEG